MEESIRWVKMTKFILLYGGFGEKPSSKLRRLVDGKLTCGYREYAKHFGIIVYLSPVINLRHDWELCITNPKELASFLRGRPDDIVWSIKHQLAKSRFLCTVPHFKLYYSCGSANVFDSACDRSLVDSEDRLTNEHCAIWFKGKDPEFWKPTAGKREFDYVLMGRDKPGKNQKLFISLLGREVRRARRVLWVGGRSALADGTVDLGSHSVVVTESLSPQGVRDHIGKAKVGILFTEFKGEGFPQSFLEMTMCGIPVVYRRGAPINDYYVGEHNIRFADDKGSLIETAERLLANARPDMCQQEAIMKYSLERSANHLLRMREVCTRKKT